MELKQEILQKIIEKSCQLFGKDASELGATTSFVADLKAKSVDLVKIIAVLEDEFGIDIDFMDFRRFATLGEAAAYVAELM
jgi:acyl carrier protein